MVSDAAYYQACEGIEILEARNAKLREALEAAANIIDKMGDMPDRKICPDVWRELECEEAVSQARAALEETGNE